jgi:hypothetical protein
MKEIFIPVFIFFSSPVMAGELVFQFNSPAFSGNGYSTHVLTIEQLEQQRKEKILADEKALLEKTERDLRNTNSYKFQNNLESRIYAQLSRQIADNLFGEGSIVLDGEWYTAETPFGDAISWKREDDRIYVTVYNSNGDLVSEFDVPIGEFAF